MLENSLKKRQQRKLLHPEKGSWAVRKKEIQKANIMRSLKKLRLLLVLENSLKEDAAKKIAAYEKGIWQQEEKVSQRRQNPNASDIDSSITL